MAVTFPKACSFEGSLGPSCNSALEKGIRRLSPWIACCQSCGGTTADSSVDSEWYIGGNDIVVEVRSSAVITRSSEDIEDF
jgi:hypothetical protein